MNNSSSVTNVIVFYTINTAAVLACALAAILVTALRLYRKVVYRLALYQVLSSLFLALLEMFQFVFARYNDNEDAYNRGCAAFVWLLYYSQWMKVLFTAWVTLHVFCFGAFQKNLKRVEPLYVGTSVFVPAVVASMPVATRSYRVVTTGLGHYVCYILDDDNGSNTALIERFALWDCPALIILFASSLAMGAMAIKLVLVYYKSKASQYKKAFKQFLPLAAFPVLFFVFVLPGLAFDIHFATTPVLDITLSAIALVSTSLWSLASGITLIVHISMARDCTNRKGNVKDTTAANSIHVDPAQVSTA